MLSLITEGWLDDLVRELDNQKDAVNNAIEELGDRTDKLLIQQEEKKVSEGARALGGAQVASKKPVWNFKNMVHMQPAMLVKEVRPAEVQSWEIKFDSWMSCSLQGTPPSDFAVSTFFLCVMLGGSIGYCPRKGTAPPWGTSGSS